MFGQDPNLEYINLDLKPGIKFYQTLCKLTKPISNYQLRIPETYYVEDSKLLVYDESKECLSQVDYLLRTQFFNVLENMAIEYARNKSLDNELLDQPAYLFRKRISMKASDLRTQAEVVTWRHLSTKIKSCAMVEMYIQKYVIPHKDRKLLYRLTYFCSPEKSRKASYVEILGIKGTISSEKLFWDYGDEELNVLYKGYNGIKELEHTGKQIACLANYEFHYRLQEIQLDFIKEKSITPQYWLVALHSYKLEDMDIRELCLTVFG